MTARKPCWKSTRTAQSPQTVRTGSGRIYPSTQSWLLMLTLSLFKITDRLLPVKWMVTSLCVSCGQWRPDMRHRPGQREEQPSSDPGRGRELCEDQSGGEAKGTSGDVQPQRDVFIKAIGFGLLTWRDATWPPACLPSCRPYIPQNTFAAVSSCHSRTKTAIRLENKEKLNDLRSGYLKDKVSFKRKKNGLNLF